jgi:hypothetical protein
VYWSRPRRPGWDFTGGGSVIGAPNSGISAAFTVGMPMCSTRSAIRFEPRQEGLRSCFLERCLSTPRLRIRLQLRLDVAGLREALEHRLHELPLGPLQLGILRDVVKRFRDESACSPPARPGTACRSGSASAAATEPAPESAYSGVSRENARKYRGIQIASGDVQHQETLLGDVKTRLIEIRTDGVFQQ